MNHILPITPLYGPTGTTVLTSLASASAFVLGNVFILDRVAEVVRYAIWPLLNTVSKGSFVKSSASERRKAEKLEVAGLVSGSIWKKERKNSGPEVERKVGRALVRKVIGARLGGTRREGRARREGRRVRGVEVRGVRMSLRVDRQLGIQADVMHDLHVPCPHDVYGCEDESCDARCTNSHGDTGERIRTVQYADASCRTPQCQQGRVRQVQHGR